MIESALIALTREAEQWARQAGEIALSEMGRSCAKLKADGTEVTDVDLRIQRMLVQLIARRCPDHAVVAEETLDQPTSMPSPGAAAHCWVIDPLDGTRNYVRGYPAFATSVALMDRGGPLLGVVRWHHTGQMYVAIRGLGATLNGAKMQVADRVLDASTLVGAQLGPSHRTRDIVAPWLSRWAVRNIGATSLHLALVASGGLAAAYAKDCWIWDLAAGALLVMEAGGVCTLANGQPIFPVDAAACAATNYPFIAGAATAHRTLLEDLRGRESG